MGSWTSNWAQSAGLCDSVGNCRGQWKDYTDNPFYPNYCTYTPSVGPVVSCCQGQQGASGNPGRNMPNGIQGPAGTAGVKGMDGLAGHSGSNKLVVISG